MTKMWSPVPTLEWGLPAQTPTQQPKECLIDMTQYWQKQVWDYIFSFNKFWFILSLFFYLSTCFCLKNILNQYICIFYFSHLTTCRSQFSLELFHVPKFRICSVALMFQAWNTYLLNDHIFWYGYMNWVSTKLT